MTDAPVDDPVDDLLLGDLRTIVGEPHVLTGAEDVEPYTHDETQNLTARPAAVVRPADTDEVARILALANDRKVPVTPRGAGTGKSGAAVPTAGGIVLALERLNRILEIDTRNGFAVVEPGVVCEELQKAAEAEGLFYPPDPASRGSSHIGGNIQTNAGGMRAVKYGTTRDFVYGLTLVLPTGAVVETGGKTVKDSSGYQLHRLVAGSEGTLAVITRAVLRLLPRPRVRATLLAPFATLEAAVDGLNAVFSAGLTPSACEIMDRDAVDYASRHEGRPFPFPEAGGQLLLELDGQDPDRVGEELERLGEVLLEAGALDALLATERKKQEELWKVRRVIAEGLKRYTTYRGVDTVVPRSRIAELVRRVRDVGAGHGVGVVCFGHAGDGNIHVNLLRTERQETDDAWRATLRAAHEDVVKAALALGGSISGEHGIGVTEREFFALRHSPEAIALMRRLKTAFDPNGILNPGKVLR